MAEWLSFFTLIGSLSLTLADLGTVDWRKECRTPENKEGLCIPLYECPALLQRFQEEPISIASAEFLRKSDCHATGVAVPNVCCETLDTSTLDCGKTGDTRIFGGNDTALGEHPWMALLYTDYIKLQKRMFGCGGSLINKRYVLTAAHCASMPNTQQIEFVRLGEHNVTELKRDCVKSEFSGKLICADLPVDFTVEKEIVHEEYSMTTYQNDVALLRLSRDVVYTDFIKPLCLPQTDNEVPSDARLVVVGWGKSFLGQDMNPVKQKVVLPLFDFHSCQAVFRLQEFEVNNKTQFCAGGEKGRDSCNGDSGGPIMQIAERNGNKSWEIVGLVSIGQKRCARINNPGIYVRIAHYLSWIRSHIQF